MQPQQAVVDLLNKGGSGIAIAYFILIGSTAWLKLLPALPDGQVGWGLVIAGGAIIGAVIQRFDRKKETPDVQADDGSGLPEPGELQRSGRGGPGGVASS